MNSLLFIIVLWRSFRTTTGPRGVCDGCDRTPPPFFMKPCHPGLYPPPPPPPPFFFGGGGGGLFFWHLPLPQENTQYINYYDHYEWPGRIRCRPVASSHAWLYCVRTIYIDNLNLNSQLNFMIKSRLLEIVILYNCIYNKYLVRERFVYPSPWVSYNKKWLQK